MLTKNKNAIKSLLITTLVAYVFIYFVFLNSPPLFPILATIIATVMGAIFISVTFWHDKQERKEILVNNTRHDNIRKMIDGVTKITDQETGRYRVYTNKDVYLVEYGTEESKLIHLGEYAIIDMTDKECI